MCIFEYICKYWFFLQLIQFVSILNKRITSQKVHHPRMVFVKRHGTNGFDLGHSVSSTNHINFDEGILRNSERVFFLGGGGDRFVRPQETGIFPGIWTQKSSPIGSPSNKSEDTSPMLCSKVTHFESEESQKKKPETDFAWPSAPWTYQIPPWLQEEQHSGNGKASQDSSSWNAS